MSKILILGDIHFPFHKASALKEVVKEVKYHKPTHIIQIGDLYDQYAFSRFSKKNIQLPQDEWKEARAKAEEMWAQIRRNAPNTSRCHQILGNHDVRILKRIEERIPEASEVLRDAILQSYLFKGVSTLKDERDELIIRNIVYMHGYRSKLGDHARFNRCSTVVGHSHTGGVVFEQYKGSTIFELNAGFLADEKAEPLRYRPQTTSKWTLGYGVIDELGPRFIPL